MHLDPFGYRFSFALNQLRCVLFLASLQLVLFSSSKKWLKYHSLSFENETFFHSFPCHFQQMQALLLSLHTRIAILSISVQPFLVKKASLHISYAIDIAVEGLVFLFLS